VEEGDRVAAGQLLATLQSSVTGPAQAEASAAGDASRASIRQAEVDLQNQVADRNRLSQLVERGFASAAALAAADGQVSRARASLDRARADARVVSAQMARAASDAATREIRAPVAGTVTLVSASPGLQVGPADEHPLFQTVVSIEDLQLEILIPEPDMSRVSPESRVRFTVDAYPDIPYDASLQGIGQAPFREGRFVSYRALATVHNTAGQLLPGMSASVELIGADSRRVMRIPARAVYFRPRDYWPPLTSAQLEAERRRYNGDMRLVRAAVGGAEFGRLFREGRRLVFSLRDGELVRHEVRIGAEADEFVEVTEGLEGGEVIVVGFSRPTEGVAA